MTVKERKGKEKLRRKSEESSLALYLNEINNIPLLSREDEVKMAHAAAAGNLAAREKLVNANLRFVIKVAKKYQGHGLPLEDLISEGNVGLLKAVDHFDVEKGYHFISYAVWWIRQTILNALCQKSRMIRLPVNRAVELVKIEQARKMIENRFDNEKEIEEIAALLNMEKSYVNDLINISRDMISLDNPISHSNDMLLKDFIESEQYAAPDQCVENSIMEIDIEKILDTLETDEAEIIRCHYGIGNHRAMSLKEIGDIYNLSKERVRQIELKALTRLKNPKRIEKLQSYVA